MKKIVVLLLTVAVVLSVLASCGAPEIKVKITFTDSISGDKVYEFDEVTVKVNEPGIVDALKAAMDALEGVQITFNDDETDVKDVQSFTEKTAEENGVKYFYCWSPAINGEEVRANVKTVLKDGDVIEYTYVKNELK